MASRKSAVKLTANFEANLASIEQFWIEADSPQSYDRLLNSLLETAIPNLERFPKMGRLFLAREARSVESQVVIERLNTRIGGGEIREYLMNDCLVLYALIDKDIYLLSIRHRQQLSFDLEAFWPK